MDFVILNLKIFGIIIFSGCSYILPTFHFHFFAVKMTLDLYYAPGSGPCIRVILAAKAIGLDLNLKQLAVSKGDTLKPEFIKVTKSILNGCNQAVNRIEIITLLSKLSIEKNNNYSNHDLLSLTISNYWL